MIIGYQDGVVTSEMSQVWIHIPMMQKTISLGNIEWQIHLSAVTQAKDEKFQKYLRNVV